MTITKITDHAERMQASQKSQFHDKPIMQALAEVLGDEVQLLEDVVFDVLTKTDLENAEGVNLDRWGRILDEARGELTVDADYRRVLQVKLAALQSDGDAPITIWIASTLVGAAVRYRQKGRACYHLEWTVSAHTNWDRVRRILDLAKPAGVSYTAAEGLTTGNGTFRFDSGPGFDQGKLAGQVAP